MTASGTYPAIGADQEATGLQEAVTGLHTAITGLHQAITGLHRAVSGAFPSLGRRGDDLSDLIEDALAASSIAEDPPEIAEDFDVLSAITMELDADRALDARQAEQFFAAGRTAIASGDLESAQDAFARAVSLAPQETRYLDALDRVRGQQRQHRRIAARRPVAAAVASDAAPSRRIGRKLFMAGVLVASCGALWFTTQETADAGAAFMGDNLSAFHQDAAPFQSLYRTEDGVWRGIVYGVTSAGGEALLKECAEIAWRLEAQPGDRLIITWLGGGAVTCGAAGGT